jgi:predicted hydrocarbon binding protein
MERGTYFQSNRRTRIYLDAIAEVCGQHGLRALLHLAGLDAWVVALPPYDDEFGVDFVDFARLNATLESMYGPRGGRALALRAGRASLRAALEQLSESVGLDEAAVLALPPADRIAALLRVVARGMQAQSDSIVTVQQEGDGFVYVVDPCPACWGREGVGYVVCHGTVGFLRQAFYWAGVGGLYHVEESLCSAAHGPATARCEFAITPIEEA